jgi:hypothetical protein
LDIYRLLRDGLVKLSDVAFCSFLNRNSVVAVEVLKQQSLANDWRHIASFYTAAYKGAEHLWFLPDNLGDYWSCMACPQNLQESEYCNARNQADALFSAYRANSKALSFRPAHEGYERGFFVQQSVTDNHVRDTAHLTARTCGGHRAGSDGTTSLDASLRSLGWKDENGLAALICSQVSYLLYYAASTSLHVRGGTGTKRATHHAKRRILAMKKLTSFVPLSDVNFSINTTELCRKIDIDDRE